MIEVGKAYYFMEHAYHHFIGIVEAIERPGRYRLKNVIRVQSCERGWTEFFRDGLGKGNKTGGTDTTYTHFPDGWMVGDGIAGPGPWNHPIPEAPKK